MPARLGEMVCKLREVMGKRDDKYKLAGQIEPDGAFFTSEVPEDQKDKPLKRGRGSQSKAKVPVMCESTPRDTPEKGRKDRKAGHLKMKVFPGYTRQSAM